MTAYVATLGASQVNRVTADRANRVIVRKTTFALTAALAINDTIDLLYLPKRHVLVPHLCRLVAPELDSNGAPTATLDIGVNGAADNIYNGADAGGALDAGVTDAVVTNAIAVSDDDKLIQLLVKTAVATGVASGTITFWAAYMPYEG